ncbi:MAG: glycosyltransferase family 2 protein [Alphaproteobacteria bacterium]|jgi:glycosyltransferase involved in cell wall biosynthesis|nr:glycosyltransferase family 2 protein [Alphaproteobacteria bacterium]
MISVIIPAYNEQDAILLTVDKICQVLQNSTIKPFEIVIVDDGSLDETPTRLKTLSKTKEITVIRHPHNLGYGRSLKDGISAAKFDTIVIIDADLTYPFENLEELLAEYNKGFDMVVGKRTGEFYRESIIKSPLRKILKFLVEFTAGRSIPDINSGFRIFSKTTVSKYFKHLCDTFSFTTSMTLAYMMTGKTVHYIDIPYHERSGQTKVRLVKDSLRTLQYIIQAINYYNPLKIFILFGILCFMGALIGFFMSAVLGLKSGFYLGVGGLLTCIIIFCFGLIADLLKQIMDK